MADYNTSKIDPETRSFEKIKNIYSNLGELLNKAAEEASDFGDPTKPLIELPYPSTCSSKLKSMRFKMSPDQKKGRPFKYIRRKMFNELLEKVKSLEHAQDFFLDGTFGVGKSHVLAVLIITLRMERPVAFIPDCLIFIDRPVPTVREALYLCFWNDEEKLKQIMAISSIQGLASWVTNESESNILWVIDQNNEFDDGQKFQSMSSRKSAGDFLRMMLNVHQVVYSATANYDLKREMKARIGADRTISWYEGFTPTEMNMWWDINESNLPEVLSLHALGFSPTPEELSLVHKRRNIIENMTGHIPLLLSYLSKVKTGLDNAKLDWDDFLDKYRNTEWFTAMWDHAQEHVLEHISTMKDGSTWNKFVTVIDACVTEQSVSTCWHQNLLDHRYFYRTTEDNIGHTTCGYIKQAYLIAIMANERYIGDITKYRNALTAYASNPSVVGFILESIIMELIRRSGLPLISNVDNYEPMAAIEILSKNRAIPTLNFESTPAQLATGKRLRTSGKSSLTRLVTVCKLFVPEAFNFQDIDCLLVRAVFDPTQPPGQEKSAMFVPIQITLSTRKTHADSETGFFSRWDTLVSAYKGYKLNCIFVWINRGSKEDVEIAAASRVHRNGPVYQQPAFRRLVLEFNDIDTELGSSLRDHGLWNS